MEQNLDDFDLHVSGAAEGSGALAGKEETASLMKAREAYLLRSTDAASMLVTLLRYADTASQLTMLEALRHILEADPSNSHKLCRIDALRALLDMVVGPGRAGGALAGDVQVSCMETLAIIGQYHITTEDLAALVRHATPAISAAEPGADGELTVKMDETLRLMLLDAIGSICTRSHLKTFFHCNGRQGWVRVAPVERFPAAKIGYTMSCWVRVSRFIGDETIFARWLQHDGEQLQELYFAKMGAADDCTRCLSVRTHAAHETTSALPFFFNAFSAHSFAADGQWHHIVFTQQQRTLGLFVDGGFVQSCAFTSYICPTVPSCARMCVRVRVRVS